ncbi:MAG: hypothetical protein C4516_00825 [Oxalobacter sp.]|nr:MAG: hypothetical protein C4516_00825 [Oxalobacter sp.]
MIQEIIVGIIVAIATISVILHFMSRNLRRRFGFGMVRLARRCGWTRMEKKLVARSIKQASAASDCSVCNACTTPSQELDVCSSITPEMLRRTIRR